MSAFRAATFALPAVLAGCADPGSYPSLAPRPAEHTVAAPADDPATPVAAPADPALATNLAELSDRARQGQVAFEKALAEAKPVVARAGAAGSESWIDAQQAVSRVESARSPTTVALAELDALAKARAEAGAAPDAVDLVAIAATATQVRALADAQDEAIRSLSGSLRDL